MSSKGAQVEGDKRPGNWIQGRKQGLQHSGLWHGLDRASHKDRGEE